MLYRHFFWDFDGTLYDTYGRITRACVKTLQALGGAAVFDAVYPAAKRSLHTVYLAFAAPLGVEEQAFLTGYYRCSELEDPASVRLYPGAAEALQAVAAGGGRNYLYTHRNSSALDWLRRDGLDQLFSDQVTGLDGFPNKPAPDALNYLLAKHGLDRQECVMVGDRAIDLDAGKNAGMAYALFDPEDFYPDYDTPWRFRDMETLRAVLMEGSEEIGRGIQHENAGGN